jgi:hypothetical protein
MFIFQTLGGSVVPLSAEALKYSSLAMVFTTPHLFHLAVTSAVSYVVLLPLAVVKK